MRIFQNKNFAIWFLVLLFILFSVINLPKIDINKKIGNISFNYIGGYGFSLGNFYRDLSVKTGLDITGGVQITLKPDLKDIPASEVKDALDSVASILELRINRFGVNEPNIITTNFNNEYLILVEIPGITDVDRALNLIGQTAQLSFKLEDTANSEESTDSQIPYPSFIDTDLTSNDVQRAVAEVQPNETGALEPSVKLVFNQEGTEKFRDITKDNIGKRLAIYLDEYILIAPTIQSAIPTGEAYITGGFDINTAKDLAIQINSGALPVPISIVSQNRVGPSVGLVSVQNSVVGGVIGLLFVVIFMILNYKRLGLVSMLSLFFYGLITLTLYKLIPVVLTLPGIAGFILSIGMAVDSNILIFEKTKEELRKGEPMKSALEKGFKSAWTSIKDANIVSLLIAFILFNPFDWGFLLTSGPVRGFAATLGLGVLISLFTGVYVTRVLVRIFYRMK